MNYYKIYIVLFILTLQFLLSHQQNQCLQKNVIQGVVFQFNDSISQKLMFNSIINPFTANWNMQNGQLQKFVLTGWQTRFNDVYYIKISSNKEINFQASSLTNDDFASANLFNGLQYTIQMWFINSPKISVTLEALQTSTATLTFQIYDVNIEVQNQGNTCSDTCAEKLSIKQNNGYLFGKCILNQNLPVFNQMPPLTCTDQLPANSQISYTLQTLQGSFDQQILFWQAKDGQKLKIKFYNWNQANLNSIYLFYLRANHKIKIINSIKQSKTQDYIRTQDPMNHSAIFKASLDYFVIQITAELTVQYQFIMKIYQYDSIGSNGCSIQCDYYPVFYIQKDRILYSICVDSSIENCLKKYKHCQSCSLISLNQLACSSCQSGYGLSSGNQCLACPTSHCQKCAVQRFALQSVPIKFITSFVCTLCKDGYKLIKIKYSEYFKCILM